MEKLEPAWSPEFAFPQAEICTLVTCVNLAHAVVKSPCKWCKRQNHPLCTTAKWHGLACSSFERRICTGIGQGRTHLVTLQLQMARYWFFRKTKERTCPFLNTKAGCWQQGGWYQHMRCSWVLPCTAYSEGQEALEVDQILLPPANPAGWKKTQPVVLRFKRCWMGSSRMVLILLSAITLRIVQIFLNTLCPNILYVL